MLRLLTSAAIVACAAHGFSQTQSWQRSSLSGTPRLSGLTFDSQRGRAVSFGGYSGFASDATMEWNGTSWSSVTPAGTSPHARWGHQLAYYAPTQRTILFGGFWAQIVFPRGSRLYADTWSWDGANWQELAPSTNPPARTHGALAYDSHRQRLVMFGGSGAAGMLQDTWLWDGTDWIQARPTRSPSARSGHAMTYDARSRRILLFGGSEAGRELQDTWVWDGSDWTEIPQTNPPSPRNNHALAFDPRLQRTILFGGSERTRTEAFADTWAFDGTTWTPIRPLLAPPPQQSHGMTFDAVRQRIVLAGESCWEFPVGDVLGMFTTYGTGCLASSSSLTGSGGAPAIGRVVTITAQGLPAQLSVALMTAGMARRTSPLELSGLGLPNCFLHHTADEVWQFPITAGTGSIGGQIPNLPALIATRVHFQAAAGDRVSSALEMTIGNR